MLTRSRRQFLASAGRGFGAAAASSLLPSLAGAAASPLAPKPPHELARAKAVIYLYMHGGVSHVDTWDPKPELARISGQTLPASFVKGLKTSRIDFTKAIARGSAWNFRRHGQSGLEISDLFPKMASHADELALVRSCHGDAFDHSPAMYLHGTGSQFPGRPSLGAWVVYGLGSENQNLPAFVVMTDGAMKCGPQGYGSGFLPAVYQGTMFRNGKSPVLDLANPEGISNSTQRATLDLLRELNQQHLATRPFDTELEARLSSYELAFRMQSEAPDAVDISKESDATKKLYGIGEGLSDDFGRKCLLARRLVERGVRFIQLFSGTHLGDDWDGAHNDLTGSHNKMAAKTDKPISGLLTDLRARGLLDSTLVIWGSEFGRTPLGEGRNGRDHHPYAFSMWFTGAGVKGGRVLGATDEFGLRPVENPVVAHDVNATILRVMGLDHLKLTYLYQGRDMRLTDVHGENEFTKFLVS
ncbi:MAG TPA: DUF1501 domain-containing protein [Bryobacteraceae bacterium]|nr:DUF1501 domain-containing protein [Bryobacteraceae bacterium]